VSSPLPSPQDGNRSSFRNVVFSRIPENGKSPKKKTPVILCVIHHRQNCLESTRYIFVYNYRLHTHKYCCWSYGLKIAVRYTSNTTLIIIFMDYTMFYLFCPLEEYAHPSILNVGALCFIALLDFMLKLPLEFTFHL
jgi:hypothetical protein